jgi:hypothetical protein
MDERTDVSAAYALRLCSDLLSALVLKGVLTKAEAAALVDDGLNEMLASHPEHEPSLREIAAVLTVQAEMNALDLERKLKE